MMPQYVYRCESCGEMAETGWPIGAAPKAHPCSFCGGVGRLVIGAGVNISATALETKGGEVRAVDEREGRWHKDMPAYYRMRKKGLQPKQIDGSAVIEDKVGDQLDIDYQKVFEQGVSREHVLDSRDEAAEIMATGVPL
jgi:predicted nucleic acid-binding Zn ribbon protein